MSDGPKIEIVMVGGDNAEAQRVKKAVEQEIYQRYGVECVGAEKEVEPPPAMPEPAGPELSI